MNPASKYLASIGSAIVLASVAVTPAQAVPINYSLALYNTSIELNNGLDADVTINADLNFTINLTPGVAEEFSFLGGQVDVDTVTNSFGSGTISPTLTINSPAATPMSRNLSQSISITQSSGSPPFENPSTSVVIGTGSPVTYDLGGQYSLQVTPLDESRVGQEGLTITFSNSASFLLTPIPEPASAFLMLAGGTLLLARRRTRA